MQFFSAKFMDFPDTSWVVKADIQTVTKPEQYAYSLFTSLSHIYSVSGMDQQEDRRTSRRSV